MKETESSILNTEWPEFKTEQREKETGPSVSFSDMPEEEK